MNNAVYYIYKITNTINNKVYIGKHLQNSQNKDNYFGSGILLKKAILKYGKENFIKEIIEYCTKDTLGEREIFWINKYNSFIPNGYNIAKGGNGGNSTNNTHVYNNGKIQRFFKEKDEIPEDFIRGALEYPIKTKILLSKKLQGNNKNQIPWNKGLKNNEVILNNVKAAKKTTIESGILKGKLNPRAKKFIFISPEGKQIEVIGNIKQFCKENNFSYCTVKAYKDKGIIPFRKTCNSNAGNNLTGWKIKTILYDSVQEAKNYRLLHRIQLKEEGKLTKRQSNISKFK